MTEAIARTFLFLLRYIIRPLIRLADWLNDLLPVIEEEEPSLQESLPSQMRSFLDGCCVSFLTVNDRTSCLINSPAPTGFIGYPQKPVDGDKKLTVLLVILRAKHSVECVRIEEPGFTIVAMLQDGIWYPRCSRAIADA